MNEKFVEKVRSPEFQEKCWKVLIEILEDKYNQKIKIIERKTK